MDEEEGWPYHQWYRLTRRHLPLDAEVPASQANRRAWVSIRPMKDSRYLVTYFEIEAERYEEILETWDYDEPGMQLNGQQFYVTTLADLKKVLTRWLDDLSKLGDPGVGTSPI